jgi:hypothetical protein
VMSPCADGTGMGGGVLAAAELACIVRVKTPYQSAPRQTDS